MGVPFYTADDLRSMGKSEAEIAEFMIDQNNPVGPLDNIPMGVAGYDENGNPIVDPNRLTPAVYNPDAAAPSQEMIATGMTDDVNAPDYGTRPTPQPAPPPAPPSAPQAGTAHNAMMGVGGPGGQVEGQQNPYDPFGGFMAGFASAPHVPYSGGLAQFAAAMGAGSMSMRREMAANRTGLNQPSSVKEFAFAQGQGYQGGYMDFLDAKKSPLVNIGGLGDGRVNVVSQEEKTRLGLDPASEYVVNKQGMPTAIKPTGYTEGQLTASGFHDRMQAADTAMRKVTHAGFKPGSSRDWVADRIPFAGNFLKSPEGQQYRQSQEDWVRAKLRKESGAVIADEEMEREIQTYFPQPGDASGVIEQKKQARELARKGMAEQSGGKAEFSTVNPVVADMPGTLSTEETDKMNDEEFMEWYRVNK